MMKFTKKLLLFVLIIAIITLAVNFVYVKRHKSDTDKFDFIPATVQICNFGSSHGAYGFNYEDIENQYDCFNFGLPGQNLSYDYRIFQYYGDHIVDGTVVFIPVSYFSLFGTKEIVRDEFVSKNRKYYPILPASLIKEYDYKTDIYVRYFPSLVTATDDLILTLLGILENANNVDWTSDATAINISENAEHNFENHVGNNKRFYDDDGNRIENQEEIDALYALIEGCQEKGAIPILITTPFLHELTDEIKKNAEDFYDHFYSIIDRIVRDTGIEYYDYAFDERFVNEYSWFILLPNENLKFGSLEFVPYRVAALARATARAAVGALSGANSNRTLVSAFHQGVVLWMSTT